MNAIVPIKVSLKISPRRDDVTELLSAFLSGRKQTTIDNYSNDLKHFGDFIDVESVEVAARILLGLGNKNAQGEANRLALAYRTAMIDNRLAPASINRRLAALRSLVKLARTLGIVNWYLDISNIKHRICKDTRGPGVLNLKRMAHVILTDVKPKTVARNYAVFRLSYDLSLRRNEISVLDFEDWDSSSKSLNVLGKGATEKLKLLVPEATFHALSAWIKYRGNDPGPLFFNFDTSHKGSPRLSGDAIYRMIRDAGEKVGVRTSPQKIRHTANTQALKAAQGAGFQIEETLDFSRHANLKTLLIYRDAEKNRQGDIAQMVAQLV